jgi:hypothetical protein
LKSQLRLIKLYDNYGLCNRLFPFAHLVASAVEYGWEIRNPGFAEFREHFVGTNRYRIPGFSGAGKFLGAEGEAISASAGVLLPVSSYVMWRRVLAKAGVERRIVLGDHDVCDLSSDEVQSQLRRNRTTQCVGLYFFNSDAATRHIKLIREYFQPVQAIAENVRQNVDVARGRGDLLVGVHIRHGDYQSFCNGIMFYSFEEYAELMRVFRDQIFPEKRVTFLVASNVEVPEAPFKEFEYTLASGHFVADVYALAECNYLLGPPSTFSEWASFYGGVPRYVHLKNDYTWNDRPWPGMSLADFVPHTRGFARCNPNHPAALVPKSHRDSESGSIL